MPVQRALIIDTETSGTDEGAEVIELGLILYSVSTRTALQEFSTLFPADSNAAEHVNKIPPAALLEIDQIDPAYQQLVRGMISAADVLVAHNAEFDSQRFSRERFSYLWPENHNPPWVCTMQDFTWPAEVRGSALSTIALAHGVPVVYLHRALNDCRLIASLFDKMPNLPAMFEKALRPKALFRAEVTREEKDLAKAAGFRWERDCARWVRSMAIEDTVELPFAVKMVDPCIPAAEDPRPIFRALVDYNNRELARNAGFEWKGKADGWQRRMDPSESSLLPFEVVELKQDGTA